MSVGFESGNQRILDLIDKGITPAQVRTTIEAMSGAGIGVQMMAFTGFPSETAAEAMDTVKFLADNRKSWTYGGVGTFVLTSGAIVARHPERFGIENLRPIPDSDIHRVLLYDEPGVAEADRRRVDAAKQALDPCDYPRPWMSATDTPHTFFYHGRYGTEVRELTQAAKRLTAADQHTAYQANGEFVGRPDDALLTAYRDEHGLFEGDTPPAGCALFRRADGQLFLIPANVERVLRNFTAPTSLAEATARTWLADSTRLWRLYASFVAERLLRRASRASSPEVGRAPAGAALPLAVR
ncbi:hypothetical protein Athai_48080 [Actinocatenispora thailandica]|uniref:Radical SAM protein n=1 Tax=Actinocatenispora thailandica TaxID=227318 RepID=A0A7R7DT10_9ACTN|nr:hypothetical protein [Actinocatenispora thailandica]BCJ37305.1 hypothetical protein Athai_48080 [Actinocatenispora thailandica]